MEKKRYVSVWEKGDRCSESDGEWRKKEKNIYV